MYQQKWGELQKFLWWICLIFVPIILNDGNKWNLFVWLVFPQTIRKRESLLVLNNLKSRLDKYTNVSVHLCEGCISEKKGLKVTTTMPTLPWDIKLWNWMILHAKHVFAWGWKEGNQVIGNDLAHILLIYLIQWHLQIVSWKQNYLHFGSIGIYVV